MDYKGDYAPLARLAREKREQSEYVAELRAVVQYGMMAKARMPNVCPIGPSQRQAIWAHVDVAIALAEQELKRLEDVSC